MLSESRLESVVRLEKEEEENPEAKQIAYVHPYAQGATFGHEKEWAAEHGQDGKKFDLAAEAIAFWESEGGRPAPKITQDFLNPEEDSERTESGIPLFPKHTPAFLNGHWYIGGKRED